LFTGFCKCTEKWHTSQYLFCTFVPQKSIIRTYLRPHRHLNPAKDEIFLLLRGRIAVFLFDNKGEITETQILDPKEGAYGAEIKAGTWHGLLVLESGSVIYEIKEGPFAPLAPENFAPWSPAPEDTEGVEKYMELLGKAI